MNTAKRLQRLQVADRDEKTADADFSDCGIVHVCKKAFSRENSQFSGVMFSKIV
jgi:hypothetical protein